MMSDLSLFLLTRLLLGTMVASGIVNAVPQTARADATIGFGPTLNVPFLADHYFQHVAVLSDGSFALSGTTTTVLPDGEGHPQFEVQTYDADGAALGGPFIPDEGQTVDTGGPVPLGDHYFVSWQHYVAKTSAATFLSRAGDPLGAPFSWPNSDIEDYNFYYAFSGAPTHRFLPVMYYQDGVDPFDNIVRQPNLQVYGADAKPIGPPVALSSGPSRIYIEYMAINGNGRFVVLYQRCAKSFSPVRPCPLGFQVFEGAGQPQTPLLTRDVAQAEGAQGLRDGGVAVGIAPGGEFLLFWAIPVKPHLYGLFLQLFDNLGSPLTDPIQLAQAPPAGFLEEQVRGLADGTFALTWSVAEPSNAISIYIGRFDPTTLQASQPLLITSDFLAAENHHFDVNDSGQGILTWTTYHPENPDPFAGHAKRITFRPYRVPKQPPPLKQRP